MKSAVQTTRRWVRSKKPDRLCPICGKGGECLLADDCVFCFWIADGCVKGKDGRPIQAKGGMGTLHLLKNGKKPRGKITSIPVTPNHLKLSEVKAILKRNRLDMTSVRLDMAVKELGLSQFALEQFGVGYDRDFDAYSFPMFGGDRKPCGIRLRYRKLDENGKVRKGSIRGSRHGLFIPTGYNPEVTPDSGGNPYTLVLPEGPTSAAAAVDLGVMAIGRPSNKGGVVELCQLIRETCPQEVVIVADRDGVRWTKDRDGNPVLPFFPGFEGAFDLAQALLPLANCRPLRFIQTPKGTKDLRDWIRDGGTAGLLNKMINEADAVTPEWLGEKHREIELWRRRLIDERTPVRKLK